MLRNAIDWNSVDEVSAWHFEQEQAYMEHFVRWSLAFAHEPGVISMEENSLRANSFSLELYTMRAILPGGQIVDASENDSGIHAAIDTSRLGAQTPVWLTTRVARKTVGRSREVSLDHPEVSFLQPDIILSLDNYLTPQVALQVGVLLYREGRLSLDPGFVPRCLFLESHPGLKSSVKTLRDMAADCLLWLRDNTKMDNQGVRCSLMQSLIPLAEITDWRMRPDAYFERVVWMLKSHHLLLPIAARTDPRIPPLAASFETVQKQIVAASRFHQYGIRDLDDVTARLKATEGFYRLG